MTFKNKFFSFLVLAISIAALTTFALGQDNKTAAPATKADKTFRGEGRGMGRGEGRGNFGGQRMGKRGGPGMQHKRGMAMMFRGLDLTDAQKTQIQGILSANKPNQANREEMRTLMMAKRNGLATAAQTERLTAIKAQQQQKMTGLHEQVLGILTPEQKAKMEARKQQMQDRMKERKQMHDQKAPAATTPKPMDN
ncbi:hypothetical protein BH10ACI3_BH10ACI3_03530 [soil metagenome]